MSDPRAAVAEVRVRNRSGVFVAEKCEIAEGWVHTEGRWRERTGASYSGVRFHPRAHYTWPQRRVDEVRWVGDE